MRWSIGALAFRGVRIWFGLFVAPALALLDQSLALVSVNWSCTHQSTLMIHGIHLLFLIVIVAGALLALGEWRANTGDSADRQLRFLAGAAVASASLSALAIVAMWLPVWMISGCIA